MPRRILDARDAAVDRDVQARPSALEAVDAIIVERRDIAVLAWRESI